MEKEKRNCLRIWGRSEGRLKLQSGFRYRGLPRTSPWGMPESKYNTSYMREEGRRFCIGTFSQERKCVARNKRDSPRDTTGRRGTGGKGKSKKRKRISVRGSQKKKRVAAEKLVFQRGRVVENRKDQKKKRRGGKDLPGSLTTVGKKKLCSAAD